MNPFGDWLPTTRDIEVITIPDGQPMSLKAGTPVTVMQSLGGSYTIHTEMGYMMRVAGKDGDAIGQQAIQENRTQVDPATLSKESVEKLVWEQMRNVFDPEIPANVVDLGLVYQCDVTQLSDDPKEFRVDVSMTLTAPGCGMGDVLKRDAQMRIQNVQGVKSVNVQMVTEPPWNPSMMSEAARLDLGFM